jgi:hypothetical protein
LQVDHPEFLNSVGTTRVQQIDWGSYSGGAFTQNANHYRDYDGHGTHCAGIACGKTYGWAKEARVYSQKLSGLEGSGDSGTGINITYAFDAIKTWHTSKAGARPTVINMSWGYGTGYNTITSLTYRGTSYTDASTTGNSTYRYSTYGLNSSAGSTSTYLANVRIGSVDTDIEELIAAGVIVCIAAGNRATKIDVSGGIDYNNFVVTDSGTIYYQRGSSPYSDNALMVGSLDSTTNDATNDQRATYSETGPGVSIWAPGTDIMSATSTTNKWGGGSQNYYLNSSYKYHLLVFYNLHTELAESLKPYYHLGKLYETLGRKDEAIATYKNGIEVASKQQNAHARSELQAVYQSAMGMDYEDD